MDVLWQRRRAHWMETRGKIVTYEEPVLTWMGDLEEIPGKSGSKVTYTRRSAEFRCPRRGKFWSQIYGLRL